MKIGPQVYVRGSVEAADLYCAAFGAVKSFEIKGENGLYAHCELSVNGTRIMALSEAPADCDTSPKTAWQIMAFNAFEFGTEEAVRRAYDLLKEGGHIIHPLAPCPWNPCCADLIDRFGVFWWLGQ